MVRLWAALTCSTIKKKIKREKKKESESMKERKNRINFQW
jgi:hypothetical protein